MFLKDRSPLDLDTMTKAQQQNHFNEKTVNGGLRLKRNHKYFWQIQAQMNVCGSRKCYFVTWTPKGTNIEEIEYNHSIFSAALKSVCDHYLKTYVPEYFEIRAPRGLPLFSL